MKEFLLRANSPRAVAKSMEQHEGPSLSSGALYGHPDAGTCRERHCDKMLKQVGFEPIGNWSGCYRHKLRAVISVYVDDFKLACHRHDEKKAWALIRKHVTLESLTPMKQYLGCGHSIHEGELVAGVRVPGGFLPVPGYKARLGTSTKHPLRCMEYDMVPFVDQRLESYVSLAGIPVTKLSP